MATAPKDAPVIFDTSSSINDFFFTFDFKTGNVWGVFFLLMSFALGAMGWHYVIVLLIGWSVTTYCYRQTKRKHTAQLFTLQAAMEDPDVARRIMGPYLPGWATFSHLEKSTWMQEVVNNLWSNIAAATKGSIVSSLNPILEFYRPKMLLQSLCIGVCELGTTPPLFDGIQTHRTDKETMIDFHFRWCGNPDIRVVAKAFGVEVEACIMHLQVQGLLRLVLGPHCTVWPCFGSTSISFVGRPVVEFDIKAAKIPLEAIPGFASWLDGFIRNTLSLLLVYPKRMVFPIISDEAIHMQEATVDPVGRVVVRLERAEKIPEGFFQTRRTYVEGKRTNGDPHTTVSKKTKSVQGKNPVYQEDLVFTVYNAPNERIDLTVFTDEHKPPVIGNLLIHDGTVGCCTLVVSQVMGGKLDHKMRLVNPNKSTINVGTLIFETEYFPFVRDDVRDENFGCAVEDSTNALLKESSLSAQDSIARDGSMASDVFEPNSSSRGRIRRHTLNRTKLDGIVIINLISCENLPKVDLLGSADPYVKLRVGESTAKTEHIKDTLNPVFNLQFQLDVKDVLRDVLEIEVHDWDAIMINARMIGSLRVPLADVFKAGGVMKPRAHLLDPKGAITFGVKLLLHQ